MTTQTHLVEYLREYLGAPYTLNGTTKVEGFDCWSWTQKLQLDIFSRPLPTIHIEDESVTAFVRTAVEGERLLNWEQIEKPVHGCIVELSRGNIPHHCGTYINVPELKLKGLSHCLRGSGLVFDPWIAVKAAGWRRFTYNVPRNS